MPILLLMHQENICQLGHTWSKDELLVKVFDMIHSFQYGLLFIIYFIFTDSSVLLIMCVWLCHHCFVTYMNVHHLLIVTDSTIVTSVHFPS